MSERSLQLDALRDIGSPEKIASLFRMLGYNAEAQPLEIEDLQLSRRSAEAIYDAYLIADQGSGGLQILLFQLQPDEWTSPSTASSRMKAIASQIGSRSTEFLLLATKDYEQLMLVNCRKSFDAQMNLKASIRKLLIDRTNPTAYDCDRLNEIAVRGRTPQELYNAQCEAFDVEKLTKQFYRGYKDLFEKVQKVIKQYNSHAYFNDSERLHQFSQRLLGRIMFLYFLQKKEFLGGDRKFLTNQYQRLKLDPEDTDYYAQVLEPLFFDTLNKQRPNLESLWGKIPYLNGGLFDRDYGKGIKDAAGRQTLETIELPNSLFDPGSQDSILGFFNGYNFTISENVQGDEDVAVDPEMLGKVFENMLAAEERGQSGTFYTPRGIVQFMCTEVLSRYLADESEMDLETVKKILDFDPDQPDSEFNKLMTSQQARKLKQALEDIKVLDPAVGSGAFPLGMMQVILAARQAVGRREGETIKRGSLRMSELKRDIIANNLYGVDIKPEAIEVAKLRMWLSLVVDIPDIEDVEPLPNLDYKLMCGDSLISTIHSEQLIPDPTKTQQIELAVTPIQQAIQPLLELQHRYFDAQTEERHHLRSQILETEANVFRVAVANRRQYWVGRQQDLERKIKVMKGKVSNLQEKERAEIAAKLAVLDKFAFEVESGERSLNFFQYHLHFRDVFTEKGGFDVVIGNPPYVRIQELKKTYPENVIALKTNYLSASKGNYDIYVVFIEKGLDLLHKNGYLNFICPHKFFNAQYGEPLRKLISENRYLNKIVYFGDQQIFDNATTYVCLLFLSKRGSYCCDLVKIEDLLKWQYLDIAIYEQVDSTYFNESSWNFSFREDAKPFKKLDSVSLNLLNITSNISQGIRTSANSIYVLDIVEEQENIVIAYSKSLDENVALEKNLISKFLQGREIKSFKIDYSRKIVIIPYEIRNGKINLIPENDLKCFYPKTFAYLKQNKSLLEDREKGKMKGANWFGYVYPKNLEIMKSSKILVPDIASQSSFAFDEYGQYAFTSGYAIILNENTSTNQKYILGLLNSKIIDFYIKQVSTTIRGGYFRYFSQFLEKIPIPAASELDKKAIEALVQKCLDAQGRGVEEWEAEIDDRVAYLYGLTVEEMKTIRGE